MIGPADIRFELCNPYFSSKFSLLLLTCAFADVSEPGFDGQKMSKDRSIRVEWLASSGPNVAQSGPDNEGVLLVQSYK